MELRVYLSLNDYQKHKTCYCRRVVLPLGIAFPYEHCKSVMRLLYGESCVVEFLCVD